MTITLIGIGTAFFLLAFLSLLTVFLPRIADLTGGDEATDLTEEETAEERNKALAATIAVSVAMSRGHLPEGADVPVGSPPSQSSPMKRE